MKFIVGLNMMRRFNRTLLSYWQYRPIVNPNTLFPHHHWMQLYVAYTSINRGMTSDGKYSLGGPGHVAMPRNPCGAVFSYKLDESYIATSSSVSGRSFGCCESNPIVANSTMAP